MTMAIPTKDTLLAPCAENWNVRLATGYATFGFSSEQAAALSAVYQPYADAWAALQAARSAGIRSASLTAEKDSAKDSLLPYLRELYAVLQASRTVSEASKELLGARSRSSQRTPLPPPGPLSNFKVELGGNGAVSFTWRADNPAGAHGTMYEIWRKVGDSALVYCDTTGQREFVDNTLPAGASSITYQVRAVRSTKVGPWAQFNVSFGTGAGAAGISAMQTMKAA
jgi:hypothetical protein